MEIKNLTIVAKNADNNNVDLLLDRLVSVSFVDHRDNKMHIHRQDPTNDVVVLAYQGDEQININNVYHLYLYDNVVNKIYVDNKVEIISHSSKDNNTCFVLEICK